MTEALGAVSRFAADALGLDRIELLHHLGNAASCQVAVKCGYRVVGVRMAGCEQRGTLHDAEVHVRETGQPSRST
jgi:RimJ/RimL family protein N-acetyltransferase